MKTLSRHLADNFPAEYQTRVEPQSNGNLVVRVGGYSARFTALPPELQENVICRIRHSR